MFHHPSLAAEEIADRLRLPYHRLARYANDGQPDNLPAELVPDVVRVTGRSDLLEDLNARAGYMTRRIDVATGGPSALAEFCDVTAAQGELAKQLRGAATDGAITPDERDVIIACVRRQMCELAELEAALMGGRAAAVRR